MFEEGLIGVITAVKELLNNKNFLTLLGIIMLGFGYYLGKEDAKRKTQFRIDRIRKNYSEEIELLHEELYTLKKERIS